MQLEAFEWPGSCPYVFTWDGSNYVADNDVYSTARGANKEFADAYTLRQPLVPKDNEYLLQLRETSGAATGNSQLAACFSSIVISIPIEQINHLLLELLGLLDVGLCHH